MVAKNTIKLRCADNVIAELVAAAAITPGMLIEKVAAGTVQAHSTADGDAMRRFALEDELQGNSIADAYAVLDPVQCWLAGPGDVVYALLANGETAVIGSLLSSNGDGYLKVHAVTSGGEVEYPEGVVGEAMEAVDMADSSAADPGGRIQVEII